MRSILAGCAQCEAITGQIRPVKDAFVLVGSSDFTAHSKTSVEFGAA